MTSENKLILMNSLKYVDRQTENLIFRGMLVCRTAAPLQVAYLHRDCVETIAGEVEFCQGPNLTHRLREHTQTVVRQV